MAAASADVGSPTDFGIPGAFCSIAVQTWLQKAAADVNQAMPIAGSPGAKTTRDQLQAKGLWIPANVIRENPDVIRPGMLAVWHRGEPGACTGHIGVTTGSVVGDTFATIEANAAPKVSRFNRSISADNLLGVGWFPCATQPSPLTRMAKNWVVPVVLTVSVVGAAYLAWRDRRVRRWLHLPAVK